VFASWHLRSPRRAKWRTLLSVNELDEWSTILVPWGRPINPVTKTNWEGTGAGGTSQQRGCCERRSTGSMARCLGFAI